MPVELGLGDPNGFVEIIVGQGRVQDCMAVVVEIGRSCQHSQSDQISKEAVVG